MKSLDETLKELEERFELRGPRNASQAIEWHGVYIDVKNLIAALRLAIEQRNAWRAEALAWPPAGIGAFKSLSNTDKSMNAALARLLAGEGGGEK